MGFVAQPGLGKEMAKEILTSGKALKKMKEIIEAQGGNPNINPDEIRVGEHAIPVRADCDGFVTKVDNNAITAIARAAGAPREKGAGLALQWKRGNKVKKDDILYEIYAQRTSKLKAAHNLALQMKPVVIEGMLLHKIPESSRSTKNQYTHK